MMAESGHSLCHRQPASCQGSLKCNLTDLLTLKVGFFRKTDWSTAMLLVITRTFDIEEVAMMGVSGWAVLLTLALMLASASPTRADYEAGQRAWEAGRLEQALTEWRSAATSGDRRAMLALGRLYAQGLGVLQDYMEAHKWFNLAASRGEADAVPERDALASKMTPQQIAAAQQRAAAWQPVPGRGEPEVAEAPTPVTGPPPPRAIREAQGLLAALGYAPGPADGMWGEAFGAGL